MIRLLILCIGIIHASLSFAEEEPDPETLAKDHKVYVEPTNTEPVQASGPSHSAGGTVDKLAPYRERRPRWGMTVALGYNDYEPKNYDPNFTIKSYHELYSTPALPLLELEFGVKYNFVLGSVGVLASVGQFDNKHSDPNIVSSELSLMAFRLGAVFAFDNLVANPLFVPYLGVGVYSMYYKESMLGSSVNGTSQAAPYLSGGVAMNLDWIDKKAAQQSYEESGIQATYLYVELRDYVASSNAKDHDFGNPFTYGGGFRLEF